MEVMVLSNGTLAQNSPKVPLHKKVMVLFGPKVPLYKKVPLLKRYHLFKKKRNSYF